MRDASTTNTLVETTDSNSRKKKKVLLVGATGFLGAKILRNLALDASVAIVAMSRKGAPSGEAAGVDWVGGDMLDPASLDHALQGVDVVVSSANGYMKGSIETDLHRSEPAVAHGRDVRVGGLQVLLPGELHRCVQPLSRASQTTHPTRWRVAGKELPMREIQGIGNLKIHEGKLDPFRRTAEKCMQSVRSKDRGTLQYDWFLSDDPTDCVAIECYRDSDALVEHLFYDADGALNQAVSETGDQRIGR